MMAQKVPGFFVWQKGVNEILIFKQFTQDTLEFSALPLRIIQIIWLVWNIMLFLSLFKF